MQRSMRLVGELVLFTESHCSAPVGQPEKWTAAGSYVAETVTAWPTGTSALQNLVDPPTAAQPARGNLVESDETDNVLTHLCRVFGPNPDTSVQACN